MNPLNDRFGQLRRVWVAMWMGLCVGLLLGGGPAAAQTAVSQDWAVIDQTRYGHMLALDAQNNAYVAGSVPRATMTLTKYGPGGAELWTRTFDNPQTLEQSTWVTLDAAGNAIVTGTTVTTANVPTGLVVLKYDSAGNLLWQDVIPMTQGYTRRAETDAAGNVYVLGAGSLSFDLITIKYSPTGVKQWTRSYSNVAGTPSSRDAAASMAVTPAGNVIITGGASATMTAVAYDPNGNTLWTKSIASASAANDVALGPQGEFYLVGADLTPGLPQRMLVVKHDASFNELWRRTYDVGGLINRAAVDRAGKLVAVGRTASAYFNWMTIKVDANGNLLWSRALDKRPNPDEAAMAVAVGPDNAVYVTGEAAWRSTAAGTITNYLGATTEKYSASGGLLWSVQAQIPAFGRGIALGSDGGVWVVANGPYALLHYRQDGSAAPPLAAVASASRTSGPEPLSVSFNAGGSTGNIVAHRWTFGDGSASLEPNPTHVFAAGSWTTTLTVTDNLGATAVSAPLTITASASPPPPPPMPAPVSVVFASPSIRGGRTVQTTVYLAGPVPAPTALTLQLTSSATGVATVPASVAVPVGANSVRFTVRTSAVRANTPVTITATSNGASAKGVLTVTRN